MSKPSGHRLTLGVVGLLLGGLMLTDVGTAAPSASPAGGGPGSPPPRADAPATDGSDLQLVAVRCRTFTPRDVTRGRKVRNPAWCRPVGIDGGIVRRPVAKAERRDRRNFHARGVHGNRRHYGTDFRAPCGAAVRAAHTGKAIVVRRRHALDSVGISTGPGRLTTWYGDLKRVGVREGKVISAGQRIGTVGRTTRRSHCHVHFAVHLRGGAREPMIVNASVWWRKNLRSQVGGMAPGERRKGSFITASFNVLGNSHTKRGGTKRGQFAGSSRRMNHTISLLRSNKVALVGLQEFQGVQRKMFLRRTHGWKVYSPKDDPQDSIAWRASRFRLVKARNLWIPYFKGLRPMPVVQLRDRATGRRLVVISVHNPANRGAARRMHKRRVEAVGRELRLVKKMRRRTGAPVILMGDFNDRSRTLYCRVVHHGLKASSRGVGGRTCRPNQVAGLDWIFGTKGVRFTAHQKLLGGLVKRTTDHPLVLTRVRR